MTLTFYIIRFIIICNMGNYTHVRAYVCNFQYSDNNRKDTVSDYGKEDYGNYQ